MTRRPEAIELFIEQSGKKLFWWEPVYDSKSMFRVEDQDGKKWFVMGDKGDIVTWEIVDFSSHKKSTAES
jgi:hypothetical protein